MDEQLLKDFVATAESDNYDWNKIFNKFPELQGYDQQLLKDYVATAQRDGYNYSVSNAKFPEFGLFQSSQQTTAPSVNPRAGAKAQQEMAPQPQAQQPQPQAQQPQQPQQQQQYNKLSYQAAPEQPVRSVERQLLSGLENAIPGFEQSMQQKERRIEENIAKKKEASALDLSLQQDLVESTARQQREASSLAPQQYETAAEKFPILRNEFLKDVYQQLQKEENLPGFVKDQLENITPDLINLGEYGPAGNNIANMLLATNPLIGIPTGATSQTIAGLSVEEAVVPKMNYMFGPLGFTFEESGMTGDYMIVTAPNKDKIEISLNNYTENSNTEEAKKLKNFIASNATKIPQIENIAAQYAGSNAKISSEKDVDNSISKVNSEYNTLNADAKLLKKDINDFENNLNALNSTPEALRSTPEYIEKKKNLDATLLDINTRRQDLIAKNSQLESSKAIVEKSVGKYTQMKVEQGTWTGATYSWLGESLGELAAGGLDMLLNFSSVDMTGDMSQARQSSINESFSKNNKVATGNPEEDSKNGGYIVDVTMRLNNYNKSKGDTENIIPEPQAGQSYKDWYNSLSVEQRNQIRVKIEDDELKRAKEIVLPTVRETIGGSMLDPNTSLEWKQLAQEGFWGGAYAGLIKSAPAMAMPGGWAVRTAAFFAQSNDAVNQEMSKNPEFAEVPESEKLLVTVPIGIANAVLEEVGLSNLINSKGFVNNLVTKGLMKAGVNTTEKQFAKIVKNDVESMLARGVLTLGSGALAEGETGALQQMAEYAVKDIYNISKEKEMFNTPDSLKEYAFDVLKSGAQEAVGGMIMGTYPAAAAAYRKRGFEGMSDDEFRTFEATANDDKMQSAYIATLKTKVASGDMTMEEAKEELNDYRRSVGVYRSVDTELSIDARKKAMNLINEKNALTQQIEGKDQAIVSRQKNRIAEINTQLNKLSENAVQEQTTSEVPVQSETTVSEKVEGGKPTAESQVTTEEVTQEEVTPQAAGTATTTTQEIEPLVIDEGPTSEAAPSVLATTQATASALESLPEGERTNITFMQEDGTEVPIMGNETMLADLFQQAQAVPESERTEFHESVIDAVNVALADQIEEEQVQLQEQEEESDRPYNFEDNEQVVYEAKNLEDIPERFRDRAVESGPQEKTVRKRVLGLPVGRKEVVKIKDKTFKFVVTGAEVNANYNLFDSLLFGPDKKIYYDGKLERAAKATDKAALFKNVSKSLASILPDLGIRNFKTSQELKAYVDGKYKDSPVSKQVLGSESGLIVYDKDGKPAEILINETTSGATTLPHEVWHAILVKAFGENEALFKEFRDSILKTLTDNGYQDIVDTLNTFSSTPEYKASNKQAQEWLVEFGGLLTASGITPKNLDPQSRTLLEQIKAVFNKVAMEMIGQPIFLDYATDEDVLDFMVSISDAMSRGEDISTFFDSKRPDAKTAGATATVSKQMGQGSPAEEVRRIAQRYNVNNNGFAPSQINEFALDKELRPYGYSAKRAAPDGSGKQRGVYILNPKGRFHNPFKGKFQKVSSQTTQLKGTNTARAKQVYNAKTLVNKLSQITGIPVNVIDDPKQRFKGKIEDRVATINLAYVTADTPIHEILGHPVIASLKETDRAFYDKLSNEVKNSEQGAKILARIKEDYSEYSEEQQMEEAIVEMLSLMVSDRLENNSVLKTMLTKLLQDIINFINKNFKTKFGESDVINMRSLSKDIENYINQTESAFERSIDDLVNLFLGSNTSTYLSVSPNEITVDGRKMLKKKYGETLSREISSYIVDAPLYADKFMKFMDNMLLDPSQAKQFLSNKTNLSYVNYKFSNFIHKGEEIKKRSEFADPFKLLYEKEYELTPVKDEDHLWTFQKDYDKGYTICTFNSTAAAAARLASNFIFWIRKPYASDILPYNMLTQDYLQSNSLDAAEWRKYLKSKGLENENGTFEIPKKASIYDPYAVSSISLQISRDPKSDFQKMVNRYNHAVDIGNGGDGNADAAFNNRLNDIVQGLDDAVRNYANLPIRDGSGSTYDKAISVGDKLFVYNEEINNHYVSPQGYVKDGVYYKINPDLEIITSGFLFNKKTKTVISFEPSAGKDYFFRDADDVIFEKSKIIVKSSKQNYTTELTLDEFKNVIGINSDTYRDIENYFFVNNRTLEFISLPNVQKIGWGFLNNNTSLTEINLPSVVSIEDSFLSRNSKISSVYLPEVTSIGEGFLTSNTALESISLPKVLDIGDRFIGSNRNISSINFPELRSVGRYFLEENQSLESISLPNLKFIGSDFLYYNKHMYYVSLPNAEVIGNEFLHDNELLNSIDLPNVRYIGEAFMFLNEYLNRINLPNVTEIEMDFLHHNKYLRSINLPNLVTLSLDFMYRNDNMRFINVPKLEAIGKNFLRVNKNLESINLPNAIAIVGMGFLDSNEDLQSSNINPKANIRQSLYGFMKDHTFITDEDRNLMPEVAILNSQLYTELYDKFGFERFSDLYAEFLRGNKKGTIVEFYNTVSGQPSVSAQQGSTLQESLKTIPGYDDMIRKSKNIALRKSRRYGANWDSIMNAVMQFVMNSPVYTLANDSQREQMVRDVRAEYGKKEKSAPSPTKVFELKSFTDLFGKIDVKMITMPELELLNQQMRDLARGAKEAKMSWMAASKLVAKQIKELVIAGKISNRQAASVISRMAMVNMFNQDSIDKFTEYMVKVFTDANYDKKINDARKRLPRALKNIKKKIGVANAVAPSLFQLFSINPNLIPDSVLERYLELVEMFGSSDSVLKLDNVSIVAGDVKKILDLVNEEVSQSEELALRFEDFADKVYDEDGKLDYAKTLAKMIEADAITDAEAEIMRKYKKNILPKVEEPAKTEAEIEEDKKALIKAIKATTINASNLSTRLERDLVKRLVELLNPKYLRSLSVNQLENVVKLIDNINNGYMPRYAMITVEKLNSVKKASEDLVPAAETAKPLRFSGFVAKVKSKFIKGTTASLQMIRRTPLAYIDQIFGDFNTKRIFNAVFEMMAKGHAAFETDINKVNKKLDDAHQAVTNSHGKDANKTLEASFRMMAYMIQLEYESNPGSDQVNPAARFIEATLNKIYDGKSKYKEADAKLLENILKEYGVNVGTDKKGNPIREIDSKKLYKSFNTAERNALKTIREINDDLTEKAQYTASIIRGESITPLNNYVHLPVMHDYNPNERSTGIQNSDAYNNSRRPSTKAKTLEGRSGDVSAINFDAFASAQKGAKATLLDFHLTEPIRTSRKTINEARKMLKESGKFKGQNRELINAIDDANEEVIRNVLTNNFITDTGIDAFVNEVSKQGYRAILASGERFTSELASNLAFAMISDPKSFVTGTKYKSVIMSPMAVDIMFNVGSKQTKRLFSADNLSGKFIDTSIIGQASGVKSVTSKSALSNVSNIIYNKSLKKYKNYIELIADGLISTPDKLVMRPVWFGSFANEFKNQTGTDIDFNKIAENDEAYMNKYGEAISNARNFADEKSVLAGASDNPFMGIIKGSNTADQGNIKRVYNNFNNFMTRFAIYEFAAARQGIYAAMGDGTLTRRQGAALLAGVATRMTTYTLLTKILGGLVLSLFGIEDEDEETEKSFMQKFGQSLASTATSIIIGRDFGNAVKTASNFGVEKINEEFFTDLRNGEYDPYEDAIAYSSVPRARPGNPIDFGDIALMFTGSFTPFAKTIDLGVRKAFEDPKKEPDAIERQKNEMLIRFPIEVLGNIGLIPMYKDVKNIVVGKIYEDLRKDMKEQKIAAKEKEFEKQRLGIYESREDMKRYNPKLYEKTFGPSSPYYEQDQMKKEQARLKSEAKRAMKDYQFGYDPDRIPTKDEMTRSELKRYFPQDYYKKYGAGSPTYKEEQEERDMEKEVRDARQAQMDAYYGYQGETKTDKFGNKKSSTKTDKFGAPISSGGVDKFGVPIKKK